METAAAAIANIIAYNVATARAENTSGTPESNPAVNTSKGFLPKLARNWDLIGVSTLMCSLVLYAASQFRM